MLVVATDWTAISAIATAAAALISAGVVVVALLQRGDSRASAQAAIRAAAAAEEAVGLQRLAAAEQSRLQTYPPVTVQFGRDLDGWVKITLTNGGNLPGLDVDIIVLGVLWDWKCPPEVFAAEYTDDAEKLQEFSEIGSNSDGGYSVMDHLVYDALPPKTHVVARSALPWTAEHLVALVQFRDLLGRNYREVINCGWKGDRYAGSRRRENLVTEQTRVEFLIVPDDSRANGEDLVEFFDLARHHIACGVLLGGWPEGIEDRGTWSTIA